MNEYSLGCPSSIVPLCFVEPALSSLVLVLSTITCAGTCAKCDVCELIKYAWPMKPPFLSSSPQWNKIHGPSRRDHTGLTQVLSVKRRFDGKDHSVVCGMKPSRTEECKRGWPHRRLGVGIINVHCESHHLEDGKRFLGNEGIAVAGPLWYCVEIDWHGA